MICSPVHTSIMRSGTIFQSTQRDGQTELIHAAHHTYIFTWPSSIVQWMWWT